MKLASARSGHVVRNTKNGSHYRFERLERGKARIFPLELFPNGLLIAKPTPTLVEPDLDVLAVGAWVEGMVVEGAPSHSRRVYENELVRLEGEIVVLRAEYEALPKGGTGKQSRGSFANKVKNVERRIATLKQGLGFVEGRRIHTAAVVVASADFERGQLVQVPSGRPAKVMGFQAMGDSTYVKVKTMFKGAPVMAALPGEVLRDWSQSSLCTV
jgi:hypothetical protein